MPIHVAVLNDIKKFLGTIQGQRWVTWNGHICCVVSKRCKKVFDLRISKMFMLNK